MTEYQTLLSCRDGAEAALRARFPAPVVAPAAPRAVPAVTVLVTGGAGSGADRLVPALARGWDLVDAGALESAAPDTPGSVVDWLCARVAAETAGPAPAALLRVGPRGLRLLAGTGALEALAPVRVLHLRRADPLAEAAAAALEAAAAAGTGSDPRFDADDIAARMGRRARDSEAERLLVSVMTGALDLAVSELDWDGFQARPRLHLARVAAFCGLTPRPGAPGLDQLLPPTLHEASRVAVFADAARARLREALD